MTIIEEYIEQAPSQHQDVLTEVYHLIKELLPEAEEKLAYGMPTFYWKENIVHFNSAKKHLGFYPTPSAITAFADQLKGYKTSKGAAQFPYDQPLPTELIKEIVLFRKEEVLNKHKSS